MGNFPESIKMIAIDIDGTLLTPEGQITSRTSAAIRAARRAGIIVTLATSRRYRGARDVAIALGLELPLIVYDGALVVHHPSRAILHCQPLSASVAMQAIDIFRRHAVQPVIQPCEPVVCVAEEVWTGPAEYDQPELAYYLSFAPEHLRRMTYEELCQETREPLRVVAFAAEEPIQSLASEISRLACSWHTISQGSYGCGELSIMHPDCSKASGVAALAAYYHIPMEQVMALGDNNNDIQMLQLAGWGVAMGQASERVQAAARAVTSSNQEDGVALAIEHYVLSQLAEGSADLLDVAEEEPAPMLPSFNLWPRQ